MTSFTSEWVTVSVEGPSGRFVSVIEMVAVLRLHSRADTHVDTRGTALAASDAVRIDRLSPTAVLATVEDGPRRRVGLRTRGTNLLSTCECTPGADDVLCEHVVAVAHFVWLRAHHGRQPCEDG